jgi:hypothetical protein
MLQDIDKAAGFLFLDPDKVIADLEKNAMDLEREWTDKNGHPVILISVYHFIKEQAEAWMIIPAEDDDLEFIWQEVRKHFCLGYAPFAAIALRPVNPESSVMWEHRTRVLEIWDRLPAAYVSDIIDAAIKRIDPSMERARLQ